MGALNRIRDANRAVRAAALARWLARADDRERIKQTLAAGGEGAADSPQRNARFRARRAGIEYARELRRAGALPLGLERRMGPTLDFTPYAPDETARRAGRPVARLVELEGPGRAPEGIATGFMVARDLLMTNHHVFPARADAAGIAANFLYEQTAQGTQMGLLFELDPGRFFVSDESLDFAIVAVKPTGMGGQTLDELGAITLIEATSKILLGQRVMIIQYPEGGPKQYADRENRLVDILPSFLHYETDTLPGSSGSPAFNDAWELVALHHAAIPKTRDGRVLATDGSFWTQEMGEDDVQWEANEGTRVSAIVARLASLPPMPPGEQQVLRALLATTTDPVDELAARTSPAAFAAAADNSSFSGGVMDNVSFQFSGPVTINVQSAPVASAKSAADLAKSSVEKVMRFDPNYENRKGYDPKFLDPKGAIVVPTPTVTKKRLSELLKDDNGSPLVLKYHHYELVMNRTRRLQMWSAVNVDYDPKRKSKRDRKEFGTDKWIADPRIPGADQIFDADFYKPAGNIDRGHIVRREDNAWGDSETDIEFANSDTFHWTNCTPQHEAFNQSAPGKSDPVYIGMKGAWGDLENMIQSSRKGGDTKMCILAGPVLNNAKDPKADFGKGPIKYPLRFWKVVAVVDAEPGVAKAKRKLRVYAFILSQQDVVEQFGIEVFDPGRFKKSQVALKQVTTDTGVIFAKALHSADQFNK